MEQLADKSGMGHMDEVEWNGSLGRGLATIEGKE